jgi:hypothetical protein
VIGRPEKLILKRDPDCEGARDIMEFRLTYEGLLLGSSRDSKRTKHKHELRRVFQRQLRRLFGVHPAFRNFRPAEANIAAGLLGSDPVYRSVLARFERCGYRFFPLATRDLSLLCSVSILFLRPDVPGGVIRSGDIDNRMKTIFDALRMPASKDELGGYDVPEAEEEPFFCLLEDDSLISHAEVETDTLLQPTGAQWEANDARLVITIRLSPYSVMLENLAFA